MYNMFDILFSFVFNKYVLDELKCINNHLCMLIRSEEHHKACQNHFLCLFTVVPEMPVVRLTPLQAVPCPHRVLAK